MLYMPITQAFEKHEQKNYGKFEASLVYTTSPWPVSKTKPAKTI